MGNPGDVSYPNPYIIAGTISFPTLMVLHPSGAPASPPTDDVVIHDYSASYSGFSSPADAPATNLFFVESRCGNAVEGTIDAHLEPGYPLCEVFFARGNVSSFVFSETGVDANLVWITLKGPNGVYNRYGDTPGSNWNASLWNVSILGSFIPWSSANDTMDIHTRWYSSSGWSVGGVGPFQVFYPTCTYYSLL